MTARLASLSVLVLVLNGCSSDTSSNGSSSSSTSSTSTSSTSSHSSTSTSSTSTSSTSTSSTSTSSTSTSSTSTSSTSTSSTAGGTNTCAYGSGSGSLSIGTSTYVTGADYGGYGFGYVSPSPTATAVNCTGTMGTTALCMSGTLAADTTYNDVAGIGFNLNQASTGTNPPASALANNVSSVVISFTNTGATTLHAQIVAGGVNYCYLLSSSASSPVTIPASSFTTACWSAAEPGTAWNGVGAVSVQMIVPSQATATTPFNVCINNVTL